MPCIIRPKGTDIATILLMFAARLTQQCTTPDAVRRACFWQCPTGVWLGRN